MTPQREHSEQLSEQTLIIYRAMFEQISFLKKQQWTITNYLLLVYAAVFSIKKEVASATWWVPEWVLAVGIGLACLYGLYALTIVQLDLAKARKDIDAVNAVIFGATERTQLKIKKEEHPFGRGLPFTAGLVLVLVFGAVIVISYITARPQ